jgi:hypothetical protein
MASALDLRPTFSIYEMRLGSVTAYVRAVTPIIAVESASLGIFLEGSLLLIVADLEHFLKGLVGSAARNKESALRRHLAKNADEAAQTRIRRSDIFALVQLAKSRVSFERNAAPLDGIFRAMFDCVVWPSEEVRKVLLDLYLVRNMIAHTGGADVGIGGEGGYAKQLRRADVFVVRSYGEFSAYHLDPLKALLFFQDALVAVRDLFEHLRKHLAPPEGEGAATRKP